MSVVPLSGFASKINRITKSQLTQVFTHLALLGLLLLTLAPLGLMVLMSLKNVIQYQSDPIGLTLPLHWENYGAAFAAVSPAIGWTLLVAVVSIILNLITSSLASYALARYDFPGNKLLYYLIFLLMFVPNVVVLVPLFLWNQQLGLTGNIWGLIATYWIMGHCFSVFILTGALRGIPEELLEAARCDGAGHLIIWRRIMLPLARPMLTALALMQLLWIYCNDYVWQYVMAGGSRSMLTVAVVLGGIKSAPGGQLQQVGIEMAGYVIGSLPLMILFLIATNAFVRGITSGGFKG